MSETIVMVNKAAIGPLNTLSKTGHSINILDVGEVILGPRGALSFVAFADSPLQQMSKLKALSRCRCAKGAEAAASLVHLCRLILLDYYKRVAASAETYLILTLIAILSRATREPDQAPTL